MEIHVFIRNKRLEYGFTQQEIADRVGVKKLTILNFENGKRSIGSDTLGRIFEALNLKIVDDFRNNGYGKKTRGQVI